MNTEQIEKARRLRERAATIRDQFVAARARVCDQRDAAERARQAVIDTLGSARDPAAVATPAEAGEPTLRRRS